MLYTVLTPLLPGFAHEFELSKTGAGLLVGAFGAGALLGTGPAAIAALRIGPKGTVVLGMTLLAASSVAFGLAGDPWVLGIARFFQGISSTTTWAGSFAWLTVATPPEQRGKTIGAAIGMAALGSVLGPAFGAVAEVVSVRLAFGAVGGCAMVLAARALSIAAASVDRQAPGALRLAFADRRFAAGLWLILLTAVLFGVLILLAPLALDAGGFTPQAIGAVFLVAALMGSIFQPLLGRFSDRVGRLLPVRVALAGSVGVSLGLAASESTAAVVALVLVAPLTFGGFYTPGMALVSNRAERAGLAQGLAFAITNSAWAAGNVMGPVLGGLLAGAAGDRSTFLAGGTVCLATLIAVDRGRRRLESQ